MNRMVNDNLRDRFEVGSVIADKYRIDRALAEGGMGVVFAATHTHLNQVVALKFLRADVGTEYDVRARFTREAQAAAQLRSEHVARVLDAGVTGDGTPYIAMEYLEGQSLAQSLDAEGALELPRAVEYMIQVCEGLAEAHSRGIIHRDIKPHNLFLVERLPGWSTVKILDFGISKFAFAEAGNIATSIIMGSPCYMSPEQLRSTATVDHRTDIWSVGATLYELLAGCAAFDALQTLPELITAILHEPMPQIHEVRPEVPAELSAIIARCLANDREARFESVGDLALALLPFGPPRARLAAEMAASVKPRFRSGDGVSDRPQARISAAPSSLSKSSLRFPSSWNDVVRASEEPPPSSHELATPLAQVAVDEKEVTPETGAERKTGAQRSVLTRPWVRVSMASAVAALLLFLLARDRGSKAADTNLQALASVAPPPQLEATRPAPSIASPAAEANVKIVVRASPPYAQILVDDRVVDNPFVATYPKDGKFHRIIARAWGFDSKSEDMVFTADAILEFGLNRRLQQASASAVAASEQPKRTGEALSADGSGSRPSVGSTAREVDPLGGRTPLRPIETKNPYGAQ